MILGVLTVLLVLVGLAFVWTGTIGMLRFPDVHSRLHALTKADNVGLGFIVLGLMLQAESWAAVGKLMVIWVLVLLAATTSCYLVARGALEAREARADEAGE